MTDTILAELNELIEGSMERDPPKPPPLTPTPPSRPVPKAGTRIQRSDRQTQAKWQGLLTSPPPLPRRKPTAAVCAIQATTGPPAAGQPTATKARRLKTKIRPAPPALVAAAQPAPAPPPIYGPELPPPIVVEYAPGRTTAVPYFAATRSRIYKLRTSEGRWKLGFDRDGRLKSSLPMTAPHVSLP